MCEWTGGVEGTECFIHVQGVMIFWRYYHIYKKYIPFSLASAAKESATLLMYCLTLISCLWSVMIPFSILLNVIKFACERRERGEEVGERVNWQSNGVYDGKRVYKKGWEGCIPESPPPWTMFWKHQTQFHATSRQIRFCPQDLLMHPRLTVGMHV